MIMNRENVIEFLNNPITMIKVESILKNRFGNYGDNVSERGFICGQSVASAIFELLDFGLNPVYNDLDIFIPVGKVFNLVNEDRLLNTSVFKEFELNVDHYGRISLGYLSRYRVLTSLNYGDINKTYVLMYKPTDYLNAGIDILFNFDINSTQVGFYKNELKLLYTDEFINFLLTKELNIVHWNTPAHSLIRLAKKSHELKNVYVNFEENEMLSMIQLTAAFEQSEVIKITSEVIPALKILKKNNVFDINNPNLIHNYSLKNMNVIFGSKYKNLSDIYISNKYYSKDIKVCLLNSSQIRYDDDVKLSKRVLDSSISIPDVYRFNFSSLFHKDPDKLKSNFINKLLGSNLYSSEQTIPLANEMFGNVISLLVKNSKANVLERIRKGDKDWIDIGKDYKMLSPEATLTYLPYFFRYAINTRKKSVKRYFKIRDFCEKTKYLLNVKNLNSSINALEKKSVQKIIKSHPEMQKVFFRLSEVGVNMEDFIELVKKQEKKYGSYIYGLIASKFNDLTSTELIDINLLDFLIKEDLLNKNSQLFKGNAYRTENIVELNTTMELIEEGDKMNHCVGGYSSAVASGNVKIFKIMSPRATVELSLFEDGWRLTQLKGRFNKRYRFEDVKHVLKELKEAFDIKMSSYTMFIELLVSKDNQTEEHKQFLLDDLEDFKSNEQELGFDFNEIPF